MFDTSDLTKKQYEYVIQILQIDTRRTLPALLKNIASIRHSASRTAQLKKMRDDLLLKTNANETNKKSMQLFLKDFTEICEDLKTEFLSQPEITPEDIDYAQYVSYYGDFAASIIKKQANIIHSFLFSPQTANKVTRLRIKLDKHACPLCKEKFSDFPDDKIIFIANTIEDAEQLNFESPCHLLCYMMNKKKKASRGQD